MGKWGQNFEDQANYHAEKMAEIKQKNEDLKERRAKFVEKATAEILRQTAEKHKNRNNA